MKTFRMFMLLVLCFHLSSVFGQKPNTDTIIAFKYFQRGFPKQMLNNNEGALKEYDSAVVANPDYNRVYFYRGLVKYHLNDLKGSIEDYTKFIKHNPTSASAYTNRGYSKYLLQDNEGAIADY